MSFYMTKVVSIYYKLITALSCIMSSSIYSRYIEYVWHNQKVSQRHHVCNFLEVYTKNDPYKIYSIFMIYIHTNFTCLSPLDQ